MIRGPGRRWARGGAWALLALAFAPAWAEAQLFPRGPIRRERPPCDHESPVFKLYRHEYFGYHPTCWRPFPMGWGCPSPEAPNPALEFQRRQRDQPQPGGAPRDPFDDQLDERRDPFAPDAPPAGDLPPMPRGDRSPFDLDPAPPAGGARSPFDLEPPSAAPRRAPGGGERALPPGPAVPGGSPLDTLPPPSPTTPPTSMTPGPLPGRVVGLAPGGPASSRFDLSDLPELADPAGSLPPGAIIEPLPGSLPPISAMDEPFEPGPSMAPEPPRRGLLAGLFGRNRR